jgi:cytochrome oxidase Cu insertion factor (SCO1/SenC/PrrC family)
MIPEQNMTDKTAASGKPFTVLLLLFAICALPPVASWFLFLNPELLPTQRSNRGELIELPVNIKGFNLNTLSGQKFSTANLDGYWTLVVLEKDSCSQICQQHINDIRQIRLALGKDMYNIQRLLVLTSPEQPDDLLQLFEHYSGMHVVTGSDTAYGEFQSFFRNTRESNDGGIYLIDPMGNIMMHYGNNIPAKDILKDMQRLLKASKHWIGQGH